MDLYMECTPLPLRGLLELFQQCRSPISQWNHPHYTLFPTCWWKLQLRIHYSNIDCLPELVGFDFIKNPKHSGFCFEDHIFQHQKAFLWHIIKCYTKELPCISWLFWYVQGGGQSPLVGWMWKQTLFYPSLHISHCLWVCGCFVDEHPISVSCVHCGLCYALTPMACAVCGNESTMPSDVSHVLRHTQNPHTPDTPTTHHSMADSRKRHAPDTP